jgi:hypothetical protein
MRTLSWFAAIIAAVAIVAAGSERAGADHEKSLAPKTFTTMVYPKGNSYDGAYISGKCVASVNVEIGSVELTSCSFIAERGR